MSSKDVQYSLQGALTSSSVMPVNSAYLHALIIEISENIFKEEL
jgi:hypothetical protein